MKKLFLVAIVASLSTVSCTKDRTCNCTYSNDKNSNTSTSSTVIVGSTKSQGKANCVSTKEVSNGTTFTSDCKLS